MTKRIISLFQTLAILGCIFCSAVAIAQAPGPDFSKATETLGMSAAELATILGSPPDFIGAAEKLGVTPEELMALLPAPPADEIPEGYTEENFLQAE